MAGAGQLLCWLGCRRRCADHVGVLCPGVHVQSRLVLPGQLTRGEILCVTGEIDERLFLVRRAPPPRQQRYFPHVNSVSSQGHCSKPLDYRIGP